MRIRPARVPQPGSRLAMNRRGTCLLLGVPPTRTAPMGKRSCATATRLPLLAHSSRDVMTGTGAARSTALAAQRFPKAASPAPGPSHSYAYLGGQHFPCLAAFEALRDNWQAPELPPQKPQGQVRPEKQTRAARKEMKRLLICAVWSLAAPRYKQVRWRPWPKSRRRTWQMQAKGRRGLRKPAWRTAHRVQSDGEQPSARPVANL
jgi:hypothetical protein